MKNEFIYSLRIHIEDTDLAGIVYHSQYLNFMERARSEWFLQLGLDMAWQHQEDVFFPVHSVNIQFLKPALVHQKIEVVTSFLMISQASIIFDQYLRLEDNKDKILCKATIKIACVNKMMQVRRLPNSSVLENFRRIIRGV